MKGLKIPPAMSIATIWMIWLFLAVGVMGWVLFVLLDAFDAKKDAAAWVQAVGSILAIVAAFLVANRAHELQRNAAHKVSLESEARAAYLAECAAFEAACAIKGCLDQGKNFLKTMRVSDARIQESRRVLRNVLSQPLSGNTVHHIFLIQEQLSEVIAQIEIWNRTLGPTQDHLDDIKRRVRTVLACRKVINREYVDIANTAEVGVRHRMGV